MFTGARGDYADFSILTRESPQAIANLAGNTLPETIGKRIVAMGAAPIERRMAGQVRLIQ
jgi:hypothetical protein